MEGIISGSWAILLLFLVSLEIFFFLSTDEVVVVNKPFGLEMFGEGQQHSLEKYLPKLAARVGAQELHQVHRLDKTTSGAVILVSRLMLGFQIFVFTKLLPLISARQTRGQWPYRPAAKGRAMANRPMILNDLNFLCIHIKERKIVLPGARIEPWVCLFHSPL